MDYCASFVIRPGAKVDLGKIDPDNTGDFRGKDAKKKAEKLLKANGKRLNELQTRLYAGNEYSAMLVNQAPDTAGKDGLIKHVYGFFNPQGTRTISFKAPSPLELSHHFTWRAQMSEPGRGQIAIFNRSHYEDVLIVRVRNLISSQRWKSHFAEFLRTQKLDKGIVEAARTVDFKSLIDEYGLRDVTEVKNAYNVPAAKQLDEMLAKKGMSLKDVVKKGALSFWRTRFDEINEYERSRARDGMQIMKFYLHINPAEQLKRLWARVDDPEKNWKLTEADFAERKFWGAYQKAYEALLSATSTQHAPWYVIPANNKWFSRYAVSEIVAARLESLGMEYPAPDVDADKIRREYYGVEKKGGKPRFDLI